MWGKGTYVIVHDGDTVDQDGRVRRELDLVDIGTVCSNVSSIINFIITVHQPYSANPVERFNCKLRICIVVGISRESSSNIEVASISNRILIIVTRKI